MTKETIRSYVEDEIAYHIDESGWEREDVMEVAMLNMLYRYANDMLAKEDLLQCANYLGYELNMDLLDDGIEQHKARKERRKRL